MNIPSKIPPIIARELSTLVGQPCTLQRIGRDRSLCIGFGGIDASSVIPHGEWEIGTYDCSWRVIRRGKVLCGRDDAVDSIRELQDRFAQIRIGKFASLDCLSEYDFRVSFCCGTMVDILATISDNDEILHVFIPEKQVAAFTVENGWVMGASDKPWT